MTRGFEHRLWGYTVVRIKQPDAERGVVSGSTSSVRPSSSTTSLDGQEMDEYDKVGIVESSVEGRPTRDDEHFDPERGDYSNSEHGDLAVRPMTEAREGSEETDGRDSVGEWQIPETVILTSGSLGPF